MKSHYFIFGLLLGCLLFSSGESKVKPDDIAKAVQDGIERVKKTEKYELFVQENESVIHQCADMLSQKFIARGASSADMNGIQKGLRAHYAGQIHSVTDGEKYSVHKHGNIRFKDFL